MAVPAGLVTLHSLLQTCGHYHSERLCKYLYNSISLHLHKVEETSYAVDEETEAQKCFRTCLKSHDLNIKKKNGSYLLSI